MAATRAATSAVVGTGAYRPPFAAGTTAATATATATRLSTSFAQIGTLPGAATRTASGAASATTSVRIVDSNGGVDSSSLLQYFTIPYFDAHTLSPPTWRYAYILWFVVVGTLIVWSTAYHLSGSGHGGSAIGAWFRKYSIRRITITKKVKAPNNDDGGEKGTRATGGTGRKGVRYASPTFAQIATILALIVTAVCLSFVGPDYISPTTCTFGGTCPYVSPSGQKGPPPSNFGRLAKRSWDLLDASLDHMSNRLSKRQNNPNGWAPFNDPLLASSNVDIAFNAWTAAARLGLLSYAMLPLAVTLAVKQWPFNIWATPFLTNYHFDKTAILHRWSGRVIWLFSSGHAAAWFYQLAVHKDPFGRTVLVPALQYWRFISGLVAYGLLTIITAFSFKPIRNRFYELFYWSHVALIILFCVACILHHRPLMYWPIVALAWWGAERAVRFVVLLHVNGFIKGIWFAPPKGSRASVQSFSVRGAEKVDGFTDSKADLHFAPSAYDESAVPLSHAYPPTSSPYATPMPYDASRAPSFSMSPAQTAVSASQPRSLPPPGFASAQLLPGRTVRLTINTSVAVRWRPGQHVFLTIPAVGFFESHPYTIVSVDERAKGIAPIGGSSALSSRGSEIVLLVRAQKGFSKRLWDHVHEQRREKEERGASAGECAGGVVMRALIGRPLGSSARTAWDAYETLMIVCGGTGITFGMSVLEYTCRRMARRDSDKYRTKRVRFVWILREFAHLSWVATSLRKCIDMLGPSQLQVELFVSRDAPRPAVSRHHDVNQVSTDDLAPPKAPFARPGRDESPNRSGAGDYYPDSDDDTAASARIYSEMPEYGEQVDSVTDLVLFEGEDDERTAGELEVSAQVRSMGKVRRALSRRGKKVPVPEHRPVAPSRSESAWSTADYDQGDVGGSYGYGYESRGPSTDGRRPFYGDSVDPNSFSEIPVDAQSDLYTLTGNSSMHRLVGKGARLANDGRRVSSLSTALGAEFIDLTEAEQADLNVVAEYAKPGYPKLKEMLDEEIAASAGKTMVACCGPNGLNTIVRHLVSSRIDLGKVLKGDPRGQVSLVCEDFSF